ncbi:MAG TPA: NAD(P)/FAD-dependent oxidoreductase [Chloroflexota bacterium]|nr:NAD(P)/FAD-dependent oxidoreductase [Chloroflexota bacterium]
MPLQTQYDAVIVGGGHNGLVAAAYLARAGQSVLLLERSEELGGATSSQRVFPGMDALLSRYSYLVSLFPRRIIEELGLPFETRRRAIASCTPYSAAGTPDALVLSNVDPERSRRSFLACAGEEDWSGFQHLRELEAAFAAAVWPSLLEPLRSRSDWEHAMRSPLEREAWDAFVDRPLGDALERLIRNDVVRGLIFTDAKVGILTHPHDESLLQNRCFIVHVIGNGTGEWRVPVGGMRALVNALADSARAGGAELMTHSPALRIHTGSPRHTVVFESDGRQQEVAATRVLVNAGPQVFDHLLGRPYVSSAADEGSVCKVNMLLRRLPRLKAGVDPRDAFAGTFHVDESYSQMQESYRQAVSGSIPRTVPGEVYCHSLTDDSIIGPDLRRQGYQTLTLFGLDAPYHLFKSDNESAKEIYLRRYLEGLNRVLAEPIEDCLAKDERGEPCIEIKSPPDLERELALNCGNIFHGELSWFYAESPEEVGRWGVETEYDRIYRAGSSAIRGGAVSGIPGRNAAQAIFEEVGMLSGARPA